MHPPTPVPVPVPVPIPLHHHFLPLFQVHERGHPRVAHFRHDRNSGSTLPLDPAVRSGSCAHGSLDSSQLPGSVRPAGRHLGWSIRGHVSTVSGAWARDVCLLWCGVCTRVWCVHARVLACCKGEGEGLRNGSACLLERILPCPMNVKAEYLRSPSHLLPQLAPCRLAAIAHHALFVRCTVLLSPSRRHVSCACRCNMHACVLACSRRS